MNEATNINIEGQVVHVPGGIWEQKSMLFFNSPRITSLFINNKCLSIKLLKFKHDLCPNLDFWLVWNRNTELYTCNQK